MDNNEYIESMASILSRMESFKKAVKSFRDELGLPEEGTSAEKLHEWVNVVEKRHKSKPITNACPYADYHTIPNNSYILKKLDEFASKFNLDSSWHLALYKHLTCNDDLANFKTSTSLVVHRGPNLKTVTSISLNINKTTTKKEINQLWDKIIELQRQMPAGKRKKKSLTAENVDLYIRIRDFESQNLSHQEIFKRLKNEFSRLTSPDEVSKFKRQIEKSFK